jgi:alpha-L-arabinofuranosidase
MKSANLRQNCSRFLCAALTLPVIGIGLAAAPPATVSVTVHARPLHEGRIEPRLFGNFVELLDDVVPGMWAELLNDRSFEGVLPAANWCYYDGSPDICDRQWDTNSTWCIDTENAFNGAKCARLTAAARPASLTQSGLSFKKSLGYTFSGHFRGAPGLKATVLLKAPLPTGEWMVLASAELPRVSAQWRQYSVRLMSRAESSQGVFELRVVGHGRLWADKLSLMPEDNQAGWRKDVVEAIREVRPGVIRWGGSSVDPGHYRWKNGIGQRDLRVPWRNEVWGRLDPNDVGIDEFCQFCALTKCEPLICVSFADGAQSAAELVGYCNGSAASEWGARRAANGHSAPYRVKYFQIGNEISGDDPQYLERIQDFISRMKKVDPDIQILSSFPSKKLLERVGPELSFVCPHHYTMDLAACDQDFSHIGQMLTESPGCGQVQIAVTEWNIDAGAWGLGRGKEMTLDAALWNARYLNVMMRHSDRVKMACRSNLANSYCGAIIETGISGSGVLKRPSYYVMYLYSHQAKPIPLALDTSGERLDLVACGAENKESVVIFAVNSKAEPVELAVSFEGFGKELRLSEAEMLADTRNAGQVDVMNHWATPERVTLRRQPVSGSTVTLPGLSVTAVEYEVQ